MPSPLASPRNLVPAARGFVFFWFLIGGIGHFAATGFFASIVPPYVPNPELAVYVSGVFELLGAAGLRIRECRRAAGAGLFIVTLCVTPANVHMWLHPEQFPLLPEPWLSFALSLRLVIQVFLLYCIWYGAIREPAPRTAAKPAA